MVIWFSRSAYKRLIDPLEWNVKSENWDNNARNGEGSRILDSKGQRLLSILFYLER